MVFYNRVIYVPAHIVSDNREFIGESLDVPVLRDKLNSLTGNISESQVVLLAKELYDGYDDCKRNNKEKWKQIKNDIVDSQYNNCTIHANWWRLRKFINKYSNN